MKGICNLFQAKTAWVRTINIEITSCISVLTINFYFLVLNYFEKTKIWLHHLSFLETKQGTKASAGILFGIRNIRLVFWFPWCESNLENRLKYIHSWIIQLKDDWYTNDATFVRWILDEPTPTLRLYIYVLNATHYNNMKTIHIIQVITTRHWPSFRDKGNTTWAEIRSLCSGD